MHATMPVMVFFISNRSEWSRFHFVFRHTHFFPSVRGSIGSFFVLTSLAHLRMRCYRIHALGLEPKHDRMWFAQLYGMRDHLAFPLCTYDARVHVLCCATVLFKY